MLENQRSITQDDSKDLDRNPIDFNDFLSTWKSIAHRMRARDHEQVHLAMIKRDPEQIDPEKFKFVLDNPIQFERLKAMLETVCQELKEELRNYYLKIELVLDSEIILPKENDTYLTGQQKFEKMATKNSNLHTLKSRFNLDIEY
jgi:hypothetical protein